MLRKSWDEVQYETEKKFGVKLIRREVLEDWILTRLLPGENYYDAKAFMQNGNISGRHDLIDRSILKGISKRIRRCKFCRRNCRNQYHDACKVEDHKKRMEEVWDHLRRQDEALTIRHRYRVVKLVGSLSMRLDDEFSLRDLSKMLPYQPHMNGLRRMCLTGKIAATKKRREWYVKGRDVLLLVKRWIDTKRAPCQTRRSKRALPTI